jgi:circadian clock protein KaiC
LSAARPRLPCLSTGSAAFDEILGGGLPVRSVNVIAGEPGAGKTVLALQMLFHQARLGKKGLYLTTLSEPSLKLATYMQQFSFFDERLIADKRVVIADLGSVMRRKGVDETLAEIIGRVEQEEPAVVVIDSFKALRDLLGDAAAMRTFNYDLAVHVSSWGAASLFVGEYTAEEIVTLSEFAIADGIIRLSNRRDELRAIREVEVLKLRGANVVTGGHFFEITPDGLAFFPRVRSPDGAFPEPEGLDARAPTGVAGLDDMLGGGLPRTSATVVQGGTGTGKTMLGLQFLLEGARQGEPGIHFALEETANQLRRIAQVFGWDLRPLEERGLLTFRYVSPVELSTDRFLQQARDEVARLGARRAVLDSLTSMALGVPSERRFKELVYAMTKHFRAAGVTITMNMEISDLLGSARLSGHGVSFAADNVIQLKYVEVDGHLERGISVLKARGVRHATDVRRLDLGEGRIEVTSAFAGMRGVLTGLPKPVKPPARGAK